MSKTSSSKKNDKRSAEESGQGDLLSPQSFTGYGGSPITPLRFDESNVSSSSSNVISYRPPVHKKIKWAHSRVATTNDNIPNPTTTQPQLVIQKFISKEIKDDNTMVPKIRGFHARSQTHKDGLIRGLNTTFNAIDAYGNVVAGMT